MRNFGRASMVASADTVSILQEWEWEETEALLLARNGQEWERGRDFENVSMGEATTSETP